MPTVSLVTPVRADQPRYDRRWADLEHWTLEACLLRAEGRVDEAAQVMRDRMPTLVRDWTEHCGLNEATVLERLRRLFTDTQHSVARTLAQRRIIQTRLSTPPHLFANLAQVDAPLHTRAVGLRHHVAIDDIAGMLDGLAEVERDARRAALWPQHQQDHEAHAAAFAPRRALATAAA